MDQDLINFIIQISFSHKDLPIITTYYEFNIEHLDIFENWYNTFDDFYINNMIISKDTIQYKLLETKEQMQFAKIFLSLFDRPFEILELIEDLEQIFIQDNNDSTSIKSNDSFYEETETINNVIDAHIKGDIEKVKILLSKTNSKDDIVDTLKKKYF
jgi:hypothetical protein